MGPTHIALASANLVGSIVAITYSGPHAAGRRVLVPLLAWEQRTAVVGMLATAVTFGPARMAYGMLLPSLREAFGLSSSAAGAIAAGSFAAFALALVATSLATRIVGAKLPIVAGGVLALGGALLVALATDALWMGVGVVLAAASAGLCWTPFNAVAGRLVRARRRDGILSLVSTGTTLGIAAMALGALALAWTGASWRLVWIVTAASGAVVAALAFSLLPPSGRLVPRRPLDLPELSPSIIAKRVLKREAAAFHAFAFMFGAVSAIFSTFAVDHVAGSTPGTDEAGSLVIGGLVFLAFGLGGATGFAGDAIERRLGMRGGLSACFAAIGLGTLLVAAAPGSWVATLSGAGATGAGLMVFSVLLAIGTLRLFPALPVVGFTVAVIAMSLGSVAGPALAGVLADAWGIGSALGAAALLALSVSAIALKLNVAAPARV